MRRIACLLFTLPLIAGLVSARDSNRISTPELPLPWFLEIPRPTTLKAALIATKKFLGGNNDGYNMLARGKLCEALQGVGLACDYNTRHTLSMFLTVNSKGLFPVSGGTNPYVRDRSPLSDIWPDDVYIGTAKQNQMLLEAVQRNAKLFVAGDLTAEAVKKNWTAAPRTKHESKTRQKVVGLST